MIYFTDIIILAVLVSFAAGGYKRKVRDVAVDFLSFLLAILIALRFYKNVSIILVKLSVQGLFIYPIAFLIAAVLAEGVLGHLFSFVFSKVKFQGSKRLNHIFSTLLAVGEGLIFVSFVVLLLFSFPLNSVIKKDIADSIFGKQILSKGGLVEKKLAEAFGGVVEATISYLIIEPSSTTKVVLQTQVVVLTVDEIAEKQLFNLLNSERIKMSLPQLVLWEDAVEVARGHAKDMWEGSYFSHYSPKGSDVGDRLTASGIEYFFAGENLALAPTVSVAHSGLMQSQGHRENILNKDFRKVAIGVIDNEIYGKMFVQVFTD